MFRRLAATSAANSSSSRALGLAGALALVLACGPGAELAPSETQEAEAAARFGGEAITVAEVDSQIKEQLYQRATNGGNPSKVHELRIEALENLISQRLLDAAAAERGVSTEEMMEGVGGEAAPVTDEDVEEFFTENESRFGGRSLDELRERIRSGLAQRARAEAQREFIAGLREQAEVEVLLVTPRIAVDPRGPSRGRADAPVTIVEFSDYQCPYCKRAETVVRAILERFPDDVRYVYRHFPLDSIHPEARGASEAAVCAEEQGRFWEYHDMLFEEAPAFASENLVAYAEKVGLDMDAFEKCLEEDRIKERVQQDLVAGRQAGVSGTPAFFVNGISLAGNRPLDDFVEVIERELAAREPKDAS